MRRLRDPLMKCALLVFFLTNTIGAYAGCCFSVEQAPTADVPPCHQVDGHQVESHQVESHQVEGHQIEDTSEPTSDSECCSSCANMALPALAIGTSALTLELTMMSSRVLPTSSGLDPPFRPPIPTS